MALLGGKIGQNTIQLTIFCFEKNIDLKGVKVDLTLGNYTVQVLK